MTDCRRFSSDWKSKQSRWNSHNSSDETSLIYCPRATHWFAGIMEGGGRIFRLPHRQRWKTGFRLLIVKRERRWFATNKLPQNAVGLTFHKCGWVSLARYPQYFLYGTREAWTSRECQNLYVEYTLCKENFLKIN